MITTISNAKVVVTIRDEDGGILSVTAGEQPTVELLVGIGIEVFGIRGFAIDSFGEGWALLRVCTKVASGDGDRSVVVEVRIEAPLVEVAIDVVDWFMTH